MDLRDRSATRPSRSQSSSSHVSSVSSQSYPITPNDSSSTVPSNNDDLDNDLAQAALSLGMMRSGTSTSKARSYSGTIRPSSSSSSFQPDALRSASMTPSGSWSHSELTSGTRSTSPSSKTSVFEEPEGTEEQEVLDPNFMSRVSQLPIVSGGLEWYERSKASSRVVKYGAGLVESSLSRVSRPLANNLQLNQLDDFACRQLDRLGASGGTGEGPRDGSPRNSTEAGRIVREEGRGRPMFDERRESGENELRQQGLVTERRTDSPTHRMNEQAVAVASRSRWQSVLVEAGGLGAAVSEESLKSLRYCLQWLLYATAHLDHQITVLRDFIISLHRHYGNDPRADVLASAAASAHLGKIKHDVVDTIRKVVDVVSKYAGAALPEQAKRYVRQSILGLPVKWVNAIEGASRQARSGSVGTASAASTPRAERMEDSTATGDKEEAHEEQRENADPEVTAPINRVFGPTADAAERVLTFAVESLDMLKSVTQIFGDSVEKAEAWIERLRVVGLDRQRRQRDQSASSSNSAPAHPDNAGAKRRRVATREGDDQGVASSHMQSGAEEEGLVRRKKGPRSREVTSEQTEMEA